MFTVVLYQPEIPPNTGNIIRLCANTGCDLHLVKPLGFPLDSSKMKRAGLDYHEFSQLTVHESWQDCWAALQGKRIFALTTKGSTRPDQVAFQAGDVFLFGPETRGLPTDILASLPSEQKIRFPMMPNNRSMNLSNTVAITVFEAWRQQGYAGGI
ncbi:tRNA (uridine(34)/cytosine(34)/5-carboxymethylaminomethyluridine(34)-2'-O)-methyltransferase TrmL [Kingella kingae]|uniref:tRNA (uridine(34)/cytosine(34)/5- carboxymethylaminomethyluridine(34)-2'-O)- methyltransferase TrmL n=1 Tax=Kingella kingae TaxID=504 RepID=UPI000426572F|nr:tRNA (uridine(34)/cytosine(34)/5-carboxymethylaminomethyluridine(34)-2'-O)-methyltransferase TrmL [Kingella kingae]MDK4525920.1 tRNA (uridine(34)/cytosine(34)/5-carboxymethylaminomethyluridine(34)-2'-O)-methyltransferase TrmL [Kingella kingae]MDK4531959.1 tRNA (uridine(34)/cytosine(34)/5-carboxymethylaminomethyluridine(34)-2'-O)-methyltransferase TrmL [Kingella kingae]QIP52085.1 tRNA (uridine(34)/cytosine(34)/5-carboxymethylaminomethyluridine(34)-2'-O)-methyltransferase TrmL [Kingella kingae]